jgi:outer membrane protein assembly factor BamB
MKRRWWKWFLVAAGLILCVEACMMVVEGPSGNERNWRYVISDWWDSLWRPRRAIPTMAVTLVANEVPDRGAAEGEPEGLDPADPQKPAGAGDIRAAGQGGLAAKVLADWPMFGGTLQRNMANPTARNLPVDWSVEEGKLRNIKWMAELGTKSFGGPVIADGKVFFGTNNGNPRDKTVKGAAKAVLMCFAEADGKFLWQAVHEFPPDPLFNMGRTYGLCSTPCVEGKRHYYVTPSCEVICAENDTGKTVWRYDLMAKEKVVPTHLAASCPLIVDDLVMVVTGNGVGDGIEAEAKVISPEAPSFIALHKETGVPAWRSNLPGKGIIEGQWSNPVIAVVDGKKQVIFPGGDCWLYSFEPATGKLIWKCNCNPLHDDPKAKEDFTPYIVSTPVVHESRCYVGLGACPQGTVEDKVRYSYFLCLDATRTGDVSPKSFDTKAQANKTSALLWAYGGPTNPPPKKGRKVDFGSTISTCAIHDGLVYIPEMHGYLHCLDARSGQRYWVDDLKAAVWGSPYYADGKVYLGHDDGEVVIYEHGKKLKKLAKVDMAEVVQSTPVVANGVLYISTWSKLYAIAEKK